MTKHIDLDALQSLAEAATSGPWRFSRESWNVTTEDCEHDISVYIPENEADMTGEFVATCDPQTMLALIARIRDLESRADAIKSAEPIAATDGNKLWWLPGHPKFVPSKPIALYAAPAVQHLSRDQIRAKALACGFKLKQQPDGTEDLNEYVYVFAREIIGIPAQDRVSDEQIEDALESARDCLVAGFGYRYNEQRLHEALRDMINSQLEGK